MTDVKVMSVTFLLDVLEIVIDSVMDPTFHVTMSHICCCSHMFDSHHIIVASVVFHQTDCTTTDRATTIDPSFKALLSYPHFASLPTSSGEELSPIHVSFVVTQFDWLLVGGCASREQSEVISC